MRAEIIAIVTFGCLLTPSVRAQDVEEGGVDAEASVVQAAPEVIEAWSAPQLEMARAAGDDARESEAWARIHDADAALTELEAAQRMVGFDLLDGVR